MKPMRPTLPQTDVVEYTRRMALFQVDFFSQVLQIATSMNVIIPEPSAGMIGQKTIAGADQPVLYLLHGLSDDHTIWIRRTNVDRYAGARGLAVVMPAVGRSYYTDMVAGSDYWRFVSDELPALVERFFRLSTAPEKTFVAGLSMGGYGALRLALSFPNRFAAVGSFSGAVDPLALVEGFKKERANDRVDEFALMFGDPPRIAGTRRDLFHLASLLAGHLDESAAATQRPDIYLCCGSEDFLVEQNRRLRSHLDKLGIEVEYREAPGTHEWSFWDRAIQRFFDWLAERGRL